MNNKSGFILLISISLGILLGCKKMDDTYREFIEDGETVYIGKADSLKMYAGDQRAELQWLLISDPKVESYKIYWNNRMDSVSDKVTKTDEVDTVRVIIDGLEEKIQEFEVFLLDKYGNSSVQNSVIGKVYGPRYRNSILNRVFRSVSFEDDDTLKIGWSEAVPGMVYTEVTYKNSEGSMVSQRVEAEAESNTLELFPENGSFQLRSAFLPDSLAIDTFFTAPEDFSIAEFTAEDN